MYDLQGLDAETVIQQLTDAYIEIDLNGNILKANISAQKLFEDKVQVLYGQNFPKLFEEQTEQKIMGTFKQLLREGKLSKQNAVLKTDNKMMHVEISSNLLYSNGKPYRIFNIIRDISESYRKQYETQRLAERLQLSESEAKLGCFEYNNSNDMRWWSKQMFEIYECQELEEVPEEGFVNSICHPEDLERFQVHFNEVTEHRTPYNIIHRVITKSGIVKYLQKKGEYKSNSLGEEIFFGTVQDVTDLYRVKEQIAKNSKLLEIVNQAQQYLILDGEPYSILHKSCAYIAEETGTDAVYLYKNSDDNDYYLRAHSAPEIQEQLDNSPKHYSYSKSGLMEWYNALKNEEVTDSNISKLDSLERSFMNKYGIKSMLIIPIHLDNHYYGFLGFDHRSSIKKWTDLEKNILLTFARKLGYFLQRADFLIELENNLKRQQEQNKELLKRNDEIDNFVYATFHDLRAPITNMLGLLDVSSQKEGTEKIVLDKMEFMVNKLYGIVNEIGEYAKNIRLPLEYEAITFDQIVTMLKGVFDSKADIKTNFGLGINGIHTLVTDRLRMEIVIKSLLENAIFYSQSAKQPNVRVDIDLTPTKAIFSVENNGDYVRPKNKNDLFKMFTTYDNKSKGSGLGLYIAREAVIKLEGKISYTSRPSRTIFKAVIPNVRQD